MAHCRLLLVGSVENLHQMYADCPDSSSESRAEMTIGADWIEEYNPEGNNSKRTTPEFTKENKELYEEILDGYFVYCFDIRDTKNYGDYGWVNIPEEMEEETYPNRMEKEERNKQRIINHIKTLPDNTVFWFADSHW